MPQANFPNFLIIGAGKGGTTSLYYYLRQHPNIYMSPIKETNFFAYAPDGADQFLNFDYSLFPVKDIATYKKLFTSGNPTTVQGDSSLIYLWHPAAPENIHKHIPEAKLICVLRNPVERAYSAYFMYVSQNFERRSFLQAITDELKMRKFGNWPLGRGVYIGSGFYFQQLKRYLHYFNDNQIKIILNDDYCQNTYATLNKIYRLLEIPENIFPKTFIRHNTSGMLKNKIIHNLLQPRTFIHQIRRHMPR
jgi:hypothetical protein